MVGDGGTLLCHKVCPKTPLTIQGHLFRSNLFVLGLSGANIVLRVQWLQELGLILTDYTSRTMNFSMLDPQLQLTADMPLQPASASTYQVRCLVQTQGVSALFQLT